MKAIDDGKPAMAEPSALKATLTEYVTRHEPGTRLHSLGAELLKSHSRTRERRAAVLAHEDLRKRLVDELGFARADQWNGYIPAAVVDPGGDERLCASPAASAYGDFRVRLNQLGRYAQGERPNDSRRRRVLLEISQEAWDRQHAIAAQAREAITKEDEQ